MWTARPTAPTVPTGTVTTKSTKTHCFPPRHRIIGDGGVDCQDDDGGCGGGGVGSSDNDNRGQDSNHHDDVRPSSSSADPPTPSLPGIAGGGGDARPQVEAGRQQHQCPNAHSTNAMAGVVVIDKLIQSLIHC
jgi:hypothetical protein